MAPQRKLQIVGGRAMRSLPAAQATAARVDASVDASTDAYTEPAPRPVFLCCEASPDIALLERYLDPSAHHLARVTSLDVAASALRASARSLVLVDLDSVDQRSCIRFVEALPFAQRRAVILLARQAAMQHVAAFADVGIGDFIRLPATKQEFQLRVALRGRDVDALRSDRELSLPSASTIDGGDASRRVPSTLNGLTPREARLYALLVERFGQVVTRADILDRAWNRDAGAMHASNITDVYVSYLRVKLARHAPWLNVRTIRSVGYVLEERA